ncbi:Tubulin-specific chaperone C [Hondaea fermentalgiana]|uniref:Tubulin-specific chaperone C n=1 Tax=Hondaea fermentalgiana TaxID=2315210 RepID=A0A2R5GJF8_9STRA|nr:Tubulin-specific chaperone C [Hondaea fermentalgiana]|eukprot:GBG31022.1 Tubulin-specific chaperone C [Hondaea fermentalgiana]
MNVLKKISPLPLGGGSAKAQVHANGASVEAKVKGWKKFYKGTITGFDAATGTYSVEFEDGDKKDGVKGFNIRAKASAKQTYTAPDGKTFEDRAEFRKYVSETFYSFHERKGESLMKNAGEIDGQTFALRGLEECEVQLMDHADQVLVDGISNCKILIGPSSESVFVRNAKNCQFFIACKQFRCRDCESCTVSLYSKTEPVVETSTGMRFYPYAAAYPGQAAHFAKANLPAEHNHWCNVFDFNKGDSSIPEPHWELIPESEGWPQWSLGGDGAENPVPKDARAEVVPKEGGFAISVSQNEAQTAFDNAQQQTAPQPPPSLAPVPPAASATAVPVSETTAVEEASPTANAGEASNIATSDAGAAMAESVDAAKTQDAQQTEE